MRSKICVISTASLQTPPTAYGGIELQAWLTVKGLSCLGHTVHLIAKEGSQIPPNGILQTYSGDKDLLSAVVLLLGRVGRPDCILDL